MWCGGETPEQSSFDVGAEDAFFLYRQPTSLVKRATGLKSPTAIGCHRKDLIGCNCSTTHGARYVTPFLPSIQPSILIAILNGRDRANYNRRSQYQLVRSSSYTAQCSTFSSSQQRAVSSCGPRHMDHHRAHPSTVSSMMY